MKLSIMLLILLSMTIPRDSTAQSLDDFQWKNRIVLLVDASPDTDPLKKQLAELSSNTKELKERDILIFQVTPDAVYDFDGIISQLKAQKIYDDSDLDLDFKGILLLGKDGGIKLKESFEVNAQEIFDLIDGMPMRRQEMRDSGEN